MDAITFGIDAAARNLFLRCAGMAPGQKLVIFREPSSLGYYDAAAIDRMAAGARDLGMRTTVCEVPFSREIETLDSEIAELIRQSDCSVFFARLGDQLRFQDMPTDAKCVVSYALDQEMLASGFGAADYRAFVELKHAIDAMVADASEIHVTCPRGTNFRGPGARGVNSGDYDVSIIRYPMSVFSPVPCADYSGKVALAHFLVGTGSRYYEPNAAVFDNVVMALFENGRLTGFEGDAQDVARAEAHYDRVSEQFGIDRNFVHSWHAGIHPGCVFARPAADDYDRWSGAAFGNPRILHFHTCGAYAPGEISWNVIDTTVRIDGVAVWEGGRLYPERVPGGADILAAYPDAAALFADPATEIGV